MKIEPRNTIGLRDKLEGFMKELDDVRRDPEGGLDVSLPEFLASKDIVSENNEPFSMDEIYYDLGVDPSRMTVENLISTPLVSIRWLVPEVIRDAIRKGLRKAPIHPNIVRSEQSVPQPSVIMPYLDFSSDVTMDDTAEAETIGLGYVSYGSKTVKIAKKAKGITISYEAIRYTNLDLVGVFFEDLGVRMGYSLDAMAIATIINGDQTDLSENAPEVGITDPTDGLAYRDLLRMWIRGGLIGRSWGTMIGDESMILTLLELQEYKDKVAGSPEAKLNVHVPIITNPEVYPHLNVPDGKLIMQDNTFGLVQLTAAPLEIESEKIIRRQIEGTVASITTGFAKIFRDSSIILNANLDYAGNGFPAWMITGYTT